MGHRYNLPALIRKLVSWGETLKGAYVERDDRISDIFYYFEKLTTLATGRTVGRKIGIVQEVLLRKYLEQDVSLRRRMLLEKSLMGSSGASHKVEFAWFQKVTVDVQVGDEIPGTGVSVISTDLERQRIRVSLTGTAVRAWLELGSRVESGPVRAHLVAADVEIRLADLEDESCQIDVLDLQKLLAALESKRVGAQRFSSSEKLGSGIQTIEKAKQASMVAVDLNILHNGTVKPLSGSDEGKTYISLVALGNGVHWTEKDLAILGTYVDYTYSVKDSAIVRYAEFVRALAGGDPAKFFGLFMEYFKGMTKAPPDEFQVSDDDFVVVAPAEEGRSLKAVISEHVLEQNPD